MEEIKYFHQPNISESLGNGWYVMKKYFLWLFIAIIISGIASGPTKLIFGNNDNDMGEFNFNNFSLQFEPHLIILAVIAILFGLAFVLLVQPVIKYGAKMMFVKAARDQEPKLSLLFKGFQHNYFNIILANLLKIAIVGIGFAALIIPGIILACRLVFVPYLVMDKELDPIRSVEESWRMTSGYGWTIFGLGLMAIPIFILGLICLLIGVFPAIIWIKAYFASMYQAILTEQEQTSIER